MIKLMFITDFTEQFAYRLMRGILQHSRTGERWIVMRVPTEFKNTIGMGGLANMASEWQADVVIGTFEPGDNLEILKDKGIVVMAQDFIKKFDNVPNITADYNMTGKMAARYFLSKGFRNFGFFGHDGVCWSDERRDAFRLELARHGYDNLYVYSGQSLDKRWYYTASQLTSWIKELPKPIAVMCCDDNQGALILEACNVCNIKVPDEVSVIGVDNDAVLDHMTAPSLSSIDVDIERGGMEAAEMAERMIRDKNYKGEDIVLRPIDIITRMSSSIFATQDQAVLKALQFIQKNIEKKIGVPEVLSEVPISRRLLEQRFKNVTGMSVYSYISKLKMDRFASLLLSTNDSVSMLAARMGEDDSNSITRRFRSLKGCTPLEYREKNKVRG